MTDGSVVGVETFLGEACRGACRDAAARLVVGGLSFQLLGTLGIEILRYGGRPGFELASVDVDAVVVGTHGIDDAAIHGHCHQCVDGIVVGFHVQDAAVDDDVPF